MLNDDGQRITEKYHKPIVFTDTYPGGTLKDYINVGLEDEKGFCAVATLQDIAKQDYILTPGRYVGIAEQEEDGEPFPVPFEYRQPQ